MAVSEPRLRLVPRGRTLARVGRWRWLAGEVPKETAYRVTMALLVWLAAVAIVALVVSSVRADVVPLPDAAEVIVPPAPEAFPGRVAGYYRAFARHDFAATWYLRWHDLRSSREVESYTRELEEFFTGIAISVGPALTWFGTVGPRAELVGFAGVWLEFRWPNGKTWRTCHVSAWVWERSWAVGPEHWYFHMAEFSSGGGCSEQTKSPGWPAPSRFPFSLSTRPLVGAVA